MGVGIFAEKAYIGGLLIVGGQCSLESMGAQTFLNYYNWLLIGI